MKIKNGFVRRRSLRKTLLTSSFVITSLFAVLFFSFKDPENIDAADGSITAYVPANYTRFVGYDSSGNNAYYGGHTSLKFQSNTSGGTVKLSNDLKTYFAYNNSNKLWMTFISSTSGWTSWGYISDSWLQLEKNSTKNYYFSKSNGILAVNEVVFATNALEFPTGNNTKKAWYYFGSDYNMKSGFYSLSDSTGTHWYHFNTTYTDANREVHEPGGNTHEAGTNISFTANTNANAGTDSSKDKAGQSNRYLYYITDRYYVPVHKVENADGSYTSTNQTKVAISYTKASADKLTASATITPPAKAIDSKANYITPSAQTLSDTITSSNDIISATLANNATYTFTYNRPKYNIAFNGNGATSGSTATISSLRYGASKALTANGFSRAFTVTYSYNGGSGSPASNVATASFAGWATSASGGVAYSNGQSVSNLTGTNGGTVTLYAKWTDGSVTLPTPTRSGYTFNGWYSGSTKVGAAGASYKPSGNITLTASWTPVNYSIGYTLNGGSASGNPTSYNIETNTFTLTNPTRTGYTFAGWTGTGLSSASTSVSVAKGSSGDRSYTANWTPINYSISYTLNGGTVSGNPTSYNIETNTFTLTNPTRTGYTFAGWTGTDLSSASSSVSVAKGSTGIRAYTANWTPISYTISYTLNGGTVTGNPTSYNAETPTFTLINPVKTGYQFTGWTGTDVSSLLSVVTINKGSMNDRSFEAHYEPLTNIKYVINHYQMNLDGRSYSIESSVTRNDGTSDTQITLADFKKEYTGFTYIGGCDNEFENETPENFVTTTTIKPDGTREINLFYSRNMHSVSIDKGEGIDTVYGAGEYLYGSTVSISAEPSPGYSFSAWSGDKNFNTNENSFIIEDEDVELSVSASIITYNINYICYDAHNNELTVDTSALPQTYDVKSNLSITTPITKAGYDFLGWGSYSNPEPGITIVPGTTGTLECHAYFEAQGTIPYTINHYVQNIGGDASMHDTSNYTLRDTEVLLGSLDKSVTPDRKKYEGFTSPSGTTVDVIDVDGHTVIDYYYTRNSYKITFNYNGGENVDSISELDRYYCEQIGTLPSTTKTNSMFGGWYFDSNYVSLASSSSQTAAGDFTLYARWFTADDIPSETYTSYQITPSKIILKDDKNNICDSSNYSVSCDNNVNAGTATALISPRGNFTGTIEKQFTINKRALTIDDVNVLNYNDSDHTINKEYDGTTDVLASDIALGCIFGSDTVRFDFVTKSYSDSAANNMRKIDVTLGGITLSSGNTDNYTFSGDTKTFASYGMILDLTKPYITKIEVTNPVKNFYPGQCIDLKLTSSEPLIVNQGFVKLNFGDLFSENSLDILGNEITFKYEVRTDDDKLDYKPRVTISVEGNVTDVQGNGLELQIGDEAYDFLEPINIYHQGFTASVWKEPDKDKGEFDKVKFTYDFTSDTLPHDEIEKILSEIKVYKNDEDITGDSIITKDEVEEKYYVEVSTNGYANNKEWTIKTKIDKYSLRNSDGILNDEISSSITYYKKVDEPKPAPEPAPSGGGGTSITIQTIDYKKLAKKYMNGYEDNTFRANDKITRAEVCAIIARISDDFKENKDYTQSVKKFKDMNNGKNSWYSNYVGFVSEKKIVNGYSDGTFKPNKNVTRGEFVKIICLAYHLKNSNQTNSKKFSDVNKAWFASYVDISTNNGLIDGYSDGTFKGNNPLTRAEACTIINRTLGINTKDIKDFDQSVKNKVQYLYSDVEETDWYFKDVICSSVKLD